MSLQSSVNLYQASAVAGDRAANDNGFAYLPYNALAATGGVKVGSFVWASSTAGEVQNSGTGAPLGFIERDLSHFNYTLNSEGTLVAPGGDVVPVAVRGDFYVVADAAAAVGATVYANLTTGAASLSSTGGIDTGYKVVTAGASGDMIIISNQA